MSLESGPMRMLAATLGAATAIVLLSGCAYERYDRYGYGYGNGYTYGDRYDRYDRNYYDRDVGDCWYDRDGERHCMRR